MLLDGKYEILNVLGAGGMGEVFKAKHLHLNAFRCIKVMKESLLADEGYRARFLREARLATQIHHPNIAVTHDFFLGEGGSYLVTEYVDGATLRQWSAAHGAFPVALAADVATQVLMGLDHIHRRGLLHRDISADNVMLSYDEDDTLVTKIIDLGVAKDVSTNVTETTQTGMLIGNPKYMSPEQLGFIPEGEQIDGRTDLYSLGVVLYEMLIGVSPFASETPQGYIMKHLTQPPPTFAAKGTLDAPPGIEAVVVRALEKDRNNRFPDARSFAAALAPFRILPAGALTRDDVTELRRGSATTVIPSLESATEREWKQTLAGDTIAGFRQYLENHPDSPQSTDAKARLFELELLETVTEKELHHDRDTLQRLAQAHPKGTAVGDAAREAMARLRGAHEVDDAFQRTWEEGTSPAWQHFIDAHPDSPERQQALVLLDEAKAFEGASSAETETGLREFLKLWPEGRHRIEAEIRLAVLRERVQQEREEEVRRQKEEARRQQEQRQAEERRQQELREAEERRQQELREAEERRQQEIRETARRERENLERRGREPGDFDIAWESGTTGAWDQYLNDHPDSPRLAEAGQWRQEATDFELAGKVNTVAIWRAFIKSWPEGRHRLEADIRARAPR
jgi:serine/threonine protein kinase